MKLYDVMTEAQGARGRYSAERYYAAGFEGGGWVYERCKQAPGAIKGKETDSPLESVGGMKPY